MSASLRLPWHFCTRQRACCNCRDILYVCPLSLYSDERHLRFVRRENIFSIGRRSWLLRKKSKWKSKNKNAAENLYSEYKCRFVDVYFLRIFSFDFWEIFCEAISFGGRTYIKYVPTVSNGICESTEGRIYFQLAEGCDCFARTNGHCSRSEGK